MTDGPRRASGWHLAIRLACLAVIAVAIGLLAHRLRRTPEQKDLTRYVTVEVPALERLEAPIYAKVERLFAAPSLGPEAARALLVDEIIPALLRLRKQAQAVRTDTAVTRELHQRWLGVTERLLEACRACVQVIDDPKLTTADSLDRVRGELRAVEQALAAWNAEVRRACANHRLAPPAAVQR
jgi:hypothetical protein